MAPQPASTFGYFQPSPIPDVATAETIRFMCGCIDGSAKNAAVQQAARDAVTRFGALGAFDVTAGGRADTGVLSDADLARGVYWFARYTIKRLHHGEFKATVAAFPEKKQLLVSPDVLLTQYPQGDCSAFTMAICALLKCLGIGYELVAVAADGRDPSIFSHVYPRAVLGDGSRLVLDAHAMPGPGEEVPAEDVYRKQVYDSQGAPVSDQPTGFKGLHMYQMRGGLGDCTADDAGNVTCTADSVPAPVYGPTDSQLSGGLCASGYVVDSAGNCYNPSNPLNSLTGSTTTAAGGTTPFNWSSEIANLANAWTKIGGQVVAPQVTQTGANGTSITGPASALTSLTSGISSMSSGSLIELLLIGGVIFFAVKMMGSK